MNHSDVLGVLETRTKRVEGASYRIGASDRFGLDVVIPEKQDIDIARKSVWILFASGERRDEGGDLVHIDGISLERHRPNPVVLFDHGKGQHKWASWPVAMAEDPKTGAYTVKLDTIKKEATLNAFWYQGKSDIPSSQKDDEKEFAQYCDQLYDLIARRFIRGGSIGYKVIQAQQMPPDYRTGTPAGLDLLQVLMLEGSAVVMPMNMDTVRGKNLGCDLIAEVLAMPQVCGSPLSPYLVKSLEAYAPAKVVQMGYESKGLDEDEASAKIKAQKSHLGHVRDGMHFCPKCGKRYYTNTKAKACHGIGGHAYRGKAVGTKSSKSAEQIRREIDALLRKRPNLTDNEKDKLRYLYEDLNEVEEGYEFEKTLKTATKAMKIDDLADALKRAVPQKPSYENVLAGSHHITLSWENLDNPSQYVAKLEALAKQHGFSGIGSANNGQKFLTVSIYPAGKGIMGNLKNLRQKYRKAKNLRRRTKGSRAGTAHMRVNVKDLPRCKAEAEKKGVQFVHTGTEGSTARVKMTGDDSSIDQLAKQFGRVRGKSIQTKAVLVEKRGDYSIWKLDNGKYDIRGKTGHSGAVGTRLDDKYFYETCSSLGEAQRLADEYIHLTSGKVLANSKTKAMKELETMPDETQVDVGGTQGNDEPLGAQVLRRLHEDCSVLLEHYDQWTELLEHEGVKGHLTSKLESLADEMDQVESLFEKEYGELPGLEGAKDIDSEETESTDAASDPERDENEAPAGEAVETEAEETPEEEVKKLRGQLNKSLRRQYGKSLNRGDMVRLVGSARNAGKDGEILRVLGDGKYEVDVLGLGNPLTWIYTEDQLQKKSMGKRKSVCPTCGKEPCACDGKRCKGGKKLVKKALPNAADQIEHTDESEEVGSDVLPGEVGAKGLEDHEKQKVGEAMEFAKGLSEAPEMSRDDQMQSYHYHKSLGEIATTHGADEQDEVNMPDQGMKDMNPDEQESGDIHMDDPEIETAEQGAKGMMPHYKAIRDASTHFKDLSEAEQFGDEHRSKSAHHAEMLQKALDAAEQMENMDEHVEVNEPGELGEKHLQEARKQQEGISKLQKDMNRLLLSLT